MKKKKQSRFFLFSIFSRWNISFFCSMLFHVLLLALTYSFFISKKGKATSVIELVKPDKQNHYFLIDLKKPRDDITEEKRVISLYNYKGWGKLYKQNQDQHALGKFNPQANETSYNLSFSNPFKPEEKKNENLNEKTKIQKNGLNKQNQNEKINQKNKTSDKLAIETKNSLEVNFWYDENNRLQISSQENENSKFLIELKKKLVRRFTLYVKSERNLNFNLNPDLVRSLAFINREGILNYEKMLIRSASQPYLSYVSQGVVGDPVKIKNLPLSFLNSNTDKLYLLLTIKYTRSPIRRWWMKLEFPQGFF